jgi:hypothetical protein
VEQPSEIIDSRRTYTFYVDDALIDHFAPQIGVYGIAVYVLLVRHAKNHQAFPSLTRITERLSISRRTAQRTLTDLEKAGLITIKKRRSIHGDADTNLYIIRDLAHVRGGGGFLQTPPGSPETPPGSLETPGVVSYRHQGGVSRELEGISLKESHLKEEEILLTSFEEFPGAETSSAPASPAVALAEVATPPQEQKKPKSAKPTSAPLPWPDEDQAFAEWLTTQPLLTAIRPPVDFEWWRDMSYVINGLPTIEWLERQYAKMQMYCKEKPQKKPTPKGTSRFVRNWLERAYNDERRQAAVRPKEVHIHYSNGRR